MQHKFKSAALAASLIMVSGLSLAEIRLGTDTAPYPPFSQINAAGELVGWEIEIGNALCEIMKEECVWTPIAWDGIIPALVAKKIDAIVGSMSITEERMKTISFSDKYYNTPAAFVAPKTSDIDGSPESVKGKILGVQVSTTHQNYTEATYADMADSIKTYQAFDEHNQDLIAGRIDAVVGDSLAMAPFLESAEGQAFEIKTTLSNEEIFGAGAGAGIRKEDNELREKFNAAIKKIRDNGTYAEISKKYFNFDIYGE
ncbi:MAG: transporter substrate-binding domain-containing protein [Granulosicoccaceae bacterium]